MRANEESADMSRQLKAYMLIKSTVAFLPRSEMLLPVSIIVSPNCTHNQLCFYMSSDEDVIELPRQLFQVQETKTHIWVERIPMPLTAEEVHVDPLSYRDWESLEAWSSQLEDLLLQQVTVVYPGQTLSLQVSNGSIARVQVKRSGFKAAESPWEDETLIQAGLPCLCLKSNTSVIVSPKPRPSIRGAPLLRLVPCMQDYNESMERFAKSLNLDLLYVPPFSAAIHPETLSRLPGYSQHLTECNGMLEYDNEERHSRKETAVVRVVPSEMVPRNAIGRSQAR